MLESSAFNQNETLALTQNFQGFEGQLQQVQEVRPSDPTAKRTVINQKQIRSQSNSQNQQTLHLPVLPIQFPQKNEQIPEPKTLIISRSEHQFQRTIVNNFGVQSVATLQVLQQKPKPCFRVAVPVGYANNKSQQNWSQTIKLNNRFSQIKSGVTKLNQQQMQSKHILNQQVTKQKKVNKFLQNVGGNVTYQQQLSLDTNNVLQEEIEKFRKLDQVAVFTNMTVDQEQTKSFQSKPPLYLDKQDTNKQQDFRTTSLTQLHQQRPSSKTRVNDNLQPKFKESGIHRSQTKVKLDWNNVGSYQLKNKSDYYPEIFDRSERTIAVTFGKAGDLSYSTPVQRIASFMDFTSRLKRRHLMDLIQFIKCASQPCKPENEDSETKTMDEYLEQSLFNGQMVLEIPISSSSLVHKRTEIPEVNSIEQVALQHSVQIKGYNPLMFLRHLNQFQDKKWPSALILQLKNSIKRFLHYLDTPNAIKTEEISKYKKVWMEQTLNLIPDKYLNMFPDFIKSLFNEVFQSYQRAMKQAIVEYIVRSPDERKRLDIVIMPDVIFTAAELQIRSGGYSIVQYHGSHTRKEQADAEIKQNLITNNIVLSQLCSWAYEFRNFNLVDFQCLGSVVDARNKQFIDFRPGNNEYLKPKYLRNHGQKTIDIDNFFAYLESHLEKTIQFLKHIWFRGAIAIIKKFKLFHTKKEGLLPRRWNFKGSELDIYSDPTAKVSRSGYKPDNGASPLQQYYLRVSLQQAQMKGFEINAVPTGSHISELNEELTLDDLVDIRESVIYTKFVKQMGGQRNLNENGYEGLNKDYKRELKYAAGNLMHLQLREIVDRSVKVLVEFFSGFLTFKQLQEQKQIKVMREINPVVTKIRQVEEPQIQTLIKLQSYQNLKSMLSLNQQKSLTHEDLEISLDKPPPILKLPDFIHLQDFTNPIFRVELLLSGLAGSKLNQELHFNKTENQIIEEFNTYFQMLIQSLNEMPRPEFCKIKVYSQKKYDFEKHDSQDTTNKLIKASKEVTRVFKFRKSNKGGLPEHVVDEVYQHDLLQSIFPHTIDFDQLMYHPQFKNAQSYEQFLGRIKLVESEQTQKSIATSPSLTQPFAKEHISKQQNVASVKELKYCNEQSQITVIFKQHLDEIKRVNEIYVQFEELIKGTLKEKIQHFISNVKSTYDELNTFEQLITEVRQYRTLITQLPHRVAFPMFEVGLIQVKIELMSRVDCLIALLLDTLEADIIRQSCDIIAVFDEFESVLKKKMESAQDVVVMDKFKADMVQAMDDVQIKLDKQKKCFKFFYSNKETAAQNYDAEDQELNECEIAVIKTLRKPAQLHALIQDADERHTAERLQIESQTMIKHQECDRLLDNLEVQIKSLEFYEKLSKNNLKREKITDLNTQLKELENSFAEIQQDEIRLFGTTLMNPKLKLVVAQFESLYRLSTTIYDFVKKQDEWVTTTVQDLDFAEMERVLQESFESYQYLWNKLGMNDKRYRKKDDDKKDKHDMMNKVLQQLRKEIEEYQVLLPFLAVLTSKELAKMHWDKINKLIQVTAQNTVSQLKSLIDEISGQIGELYEILQSATELNQMKKALNEIQQHWEPQSFTIIQIPDSDIKILDSVQLTIMQHTLEEHEQIILQVTQDKEVAPIWSYAQEWLKKIQFLNKFVETLIQVQQVYIESVQIYERISLIDQQEEVVFDLEAYSNLDQTWHLLIARLEVIDAKVVKSTLMPDILLKMQSLQLLKITSKKPEVVRKDSSSFQLSSQKDSADNSRSEPVVSKKIEVGSFEEK